MAKLYTEAIDKVTEVKDSEYVDFHARRLVEMAGNIIMGYLLLEDASRTPSFAKSADVDDLYKNGMAHGLSIGFPYGWSLHPAERTSWSYLRMAW